MADTQNPMRQMPEKQQNIINDTWSQLLGAEGGVQNLAMSLFKSFAASQLGGQSGAGGAVGGGAQASADAEQAPTPSAPQDDPSTNNATASGDVGEGADGQPKDQWYEYGKMAGDWVRNAMGGAGGAAGEASKPVASAPPPQTGGQNTAGGGLLDHFGGLGGLTNIAGQFLGGGGGQAGAAGGGGGGLGNMLTAVGGLGGLAALAGNLKDPSSLLSFFMKSPVANAASSPNSSSGDIYEMIKGTIFNLMGSKLPAENFQQNPEAKSAWKGYLSVIANAIHKMTS